MLFNNSTLKIVIKYSVDSDGERHVAFWLKDKDQEVYVMGGSAEFGVAIMISRLKEVLGEELEVEIENG